MLSAPDPGTTLAAGSRPRIFFDNGSIQAAGIWLLINDPSALKAARTFARQSPTRSKILAYAPPEIRLATAAAADKSPMRSFGIGTCPSRRTPLRIRVPPELKQKES